MYSFMVHLDVHYWKGHLFCVAKGVGLSPAPINIYIIVMRVGTLLCGICERTLEVEEVSATENI